MRQKIVAGNWKMNTNREEAESLAAALSSQFIGGSGVKMVVCPPFPWIMSVNQLLSVTEIAIGAQNCSGQSSGAFTGEVSASMLASAGVSYVITGHSERRSLYNESDADVLTKTLKILGENMTPIVCVGETLQERESGRLEEIISRQITSVLNGLNKDQIASIVIAYEPVWAIGTGLTASPEQAQEVHAFIRSLISGISGAEVADSLPILYGGSCNPGNAASLFACPDIDGGLIGGASLKAADFISISNSF
ncbi:MAG: triose-phosphate isomerase [Bacteroidetes bacterium]|nr:triose-phosphate isomerase [Bacteroidota bacterium]